MPPEHVRQRKKDKKKRAKGLGIMAEQLMWKDGTLVYKQNGEEIKNPTTPTQPPRRMPAARRTKKTKEPIG